MNTQEIINICLDKGIRLSVDNGNLQIDAPKDGLTDNILTLLRSHKADLISFIESFSAQEQAVKKQLLKKSEKTGPAPLSFAQQRLWIVDRIEQGTAQYNMSAAFMLEGSLNKSAFINTINTIVKRHDILRTVYKEVDNECVQVVQDHVETAVQEIDISELADDDVFNKIKELAERDALKPFNLSKDTMLRTQLIKAENSKHFVLFNMHHIASDGWSIGVLIKEFKELYSAFALGKESPLPELEVQYSDYAHWQRDWLQGEVMDTEMEYWSEQLEELPIIHSLPLDNARPTIQSFLGKSIKRELSPSVLVDLNNFCQTEGVTQFMILQTLYALVLSNWSREKDIVMGTPVAGRTQQNVEPLIGFFLNNLVLRTDLSGNPSFRDLLNRNKQTLLEAFEHQHMPFAALVEELNPERSSSYQSLFQIWFVLQNHETGELDLPGLKMSIPDEMSSDLDTVNFDVSLSVAEVEGKLVLDWEYQSNLFDAETIEELTLAYETLLLSALSNPASPIQHLPMIAANSKQPWAVTSQQGYPNDTSLSELIAYQAENTPNATAIVYQDQSLSYKELNEKANRVAHSLINQGVSQNSPVGLCAERSVEMLIAQLGIMKAGAAYVPLDPLAPRERLGYIIEDTKLNVVVTTKAHQSKLPDEISTFTFLDNALESDWLEEFSGQTLNVKVNADNLAYILYTSGSTGKPKGVAIAHKSVVNLAYSMKGVLADRGLTGHYRWAWSAPMIFDASVQALTQLAFGVELHLLSENTRKNPTTLLDYLQNSEIDLMDSTPSLVDLLLKEAQLRNQVLPSLLVGGEAISTDLWAGLWKHFSTNEGFALNVYGPTECTVNTTFADINDCKQPHIGRELQNIRLYVMNDAQQVLPVGAKGELYVGGDCLAQGYYNNEALTAECFVNSEGYGRLYKTGDLVRWRHDGNLEYLGRTDYQVKLRGYRIELGEIETVLLEHPKVQDAVVLVKDEQLVAFLVADDVTETSLKEQMEGRLPSYMIASKIEILDEIPLTRNGKQDRKALLALELTAITDVYSAPETETELQIQLIWQDLLGLDSISVEANFFEIGGHSLLGIRLASACREKLNMELPLKTLMENPTIRSIARQCDWYEKQRQVLAAGINNDNAAERMVI